MSNYVRGERCPVTGATDVVTTSDGGFMCLSSGVKWASPKGRRIDRASVEAFRKRGPLSSRGQSDPGVSRSNDNAANAYADMTKDQLEAEAERRGIEVTRLDGQDGEPLKSDYIAALSDADHGE